MKAEKILVPTDFSDCGNAALAMAASIARDTGAKLLIVHVQEPPIAYEGVFGVVPLPGDETLNDELEKITPDDPNIQCEHLLVTGAPETAIVRVADENDVDLIVLASHGRTGLVHALMGSVAESVIRRANCPVLTVKHPSSE